MKRRGRIVTTIAMLSLAIAMLVVGVYAALTVSYNIKGQISYTVEDVFVEITTKVYRSEKVMKKLMKRLESFQL